MKPSCRMIVAASLLGLPVFLPGLTGTQKENAQPENVAPEMVSDDRIGASIAKGQLLVTLHGGVKEEELGKIFERLDAKFTILKRIPSMNHYVIATDHVRLPELRQRIENHPYVAAVSYNALVNLKRVTKDPVFNKPVEKPEDKDNWNLYRIKVPEAWDITQGGAVVAVIDSGAVMEHEDLVGRTTTPHSFATNSPIMQAGMKKLWYAANNIQDGEVRNHGTHVAITIGGKADNNVGTAGVAPNSPIMPLQALYYLPKEPGSDSGQIRGWGSAVTEAMAMAIDRGAQVINMSLGGVNEADMARWRAAKTPQDKQAIYAKMTADAKVFADQLAPFLDRAIQAGVIVVVAAGNDDLPAEFGGYAMSRRCIVVAATDREDKRVNFMQSTTPGQPVWASNYGPYTTVSAPGHDIWSGWAEPGKPYKFDEGTSMACPHVAGVVALMKTVDPLLRLGDVADILIKTGRPLQTDQPIGPLVNARAALDEVRRRQAMRVQPQPNPTPIVQPPTQNPTLPTLPPDAIQILGRPDPWNDPDVQRIIRVWFSFAVARAPQGGDANGVWVFNRFGQVVNVRTQVSFQQPIWFEFTFRFFWENSMSIESTNMGSLYEFVVGTLRQGRFDPAPPRERVPAQFRPRDDDPRPRPGMNGLPFNSILVGTRWSGRNGKGETLEFDFTGNAVTVRRANVATRYTVRINTAVQPATIDFYPEGGGAPLLGAVELVGFGEMLVRTDFTNTRPTTISRGDPATFVLRRADIPIAEPGTTDDGIAMPILHRGIESLLVTYFPEKFLPKDAQPPIWKLPDGFQVHHYALSRDGQRVWVLLYDNPFDAIKNRWQLWSMRIDGTDAKQATFKHDPKIYLAPTVLTNADGSVAWLFIRRPIPFQDPWNVQLQQVPPGGDAKIVLESKDHKGLTSPLEPCVTADGQSLFFLTTEGVVRAKADGSVHVVQHTKDIVHGDYSFADARERLGNLVINADGSHWAATGVFFFLNKKWQNAKTPSVLIVGSPGGIQIHSELRKAAPFANLSISNDGKTVVFEKDYSLWVWRIGHVTPVLPEAHAVYSGTLAGNGNALYGVMNYAGTTAQGLSGFVQELDTGKRRLAITGFLGSRWFAGRGLQLSNDGKVVGTLSAGASQTGPLGLSISRSGGDAPSDFPQIKSIRERYDGGKLVLTVEASAQGPFSVYAMPLKNSYVNPAHVVIATANPLLNMAGLPDGHVVQAVPKRPGVFQSVVDLGDKHRYLDHSYTIRVIVMNASRNRLTFQDVAVLK